MNDDALHCPPKIAIGFRQAQCLSVAAWLGAPEVIGDKSSGFFRWPGFRNPRIFNKPTWLFPDFGKTARHTVAFLLEVSMFRGQW